MVRYLEKKFKIFFVVGETVETAGGGTVALADGVLGAEQQPVSRLQATWSSTSAPSTATALQSSARQSGWYSLTGFFLCFLTPWNGFVLTVSGLYMCGKLIAWENNYFFLWEAITHMWEMVFFLGFSVLNLHRDG